MSYYHVCTDGLSRNLWFYDEDDYVAGMNMVPACAINCGVTILCFTLMSNHVHFVVRGPEVDCTRFIWEYKRMRSRQLVCKYGRKRSIAGAGAYVGKIVKEDKLKNVIAYVMRNPLSAGLLVMPDDYRWGTSDLYFADRKLWASRYSRMGEFSVRLRRQLFRTRVSLPDDYMVYDGRMIFPGSYVDYRAVERLFRTPKQLLFHLSSAKDVEAELETGILARVGHGDAELSASLNAVCAEKFSGRFLDQLTIEELYVLARELRRRYGSGPKQLARILSLDYEALKCML